MFLTLHHFSLSPPVLCLFVGAFVGAVYVLLISLLHPFWVRRRIQKGNWPRYRRRMFLARAGMVLIFSATALSAVYLESYSWRQTALIALMIVLCLLVYSKPFHRKDR